MLTFKHFPRITLILLLSSVYLASMAPGLTWANDGADGGDLISAAATGGVAHPSGYPTYLLLARLFQYIPAGSLAYRTNLMSAVMAVCTSLVIYELVSKSQNWIASLTSAFMFGLSPLFWSQAVITEVYTLHILFMVTLLFMSTMDSCHHFLFGLIFGFGMGNHITTIFLLPLLLCWNQKDLLKRLLGVVLGLLVYVILPLRAFSHPLVNWGGVVSLQNFFWLISGKLYQTRFFLFDRWELLGRSRALAALLLEQFGVMGLGLGFTGLIVFYKRSLLYYEMLWITFCFIVFPLMYDTRDSYLYLLPVFLCFAIWIGIGLGNLMDVVLKDFKRSRILAGVIVLAVFLVQAKGNWLLVDASRDHRAENFGREVMNRAPHNAIVFARGDQAVLALWYFHYALRERPDTVIIATELLSNEWYQDMVRMNYRTLSLPTYFIFPEVVISHNPARPVCYVEYISSISLKCSQP